MNIIVGQRLYFDKNFELVNHLLNINLKKLQRTVYKTNNQNYGDIWITCLDNTLRGSYRDYFSTDNTIVEESSISPIDAVKIKRRLVFQKFDSNPRYYIFVGVYEEERVNGNKRFWKKLVQDEVSLLELQSNLDSKK